MLRFPPRHEETDEPLDAEIAGLFERAAHIPGPELTAVARARGRLLEAVATAEQSGSRGRRWLLAAVGGGGAWAALLGAAAAHKAVVIVAATGLLAGGMVAADTSGVIDTGVISSIGESVGVTSSGGDGDSDPVAATDHVEEHSDDTADGEHDGEGEGHSEGENEAEGDEDRFADRNDHPEQSSVQNVKAEADGVPGGLHTLVHDDGRFNIRGALVAVDPVAGTIDVEVATANGVSEVVTLTLDDSTRVNVPGKGQSTRGDDRGRPADRGRPDDPGSQGNGKGKKSDDPDTAGETDEGNALDEDGDPDVDDADGKGKGKDNGSGNGNSGRGNGQDRAKDDDSARVPGAGSFLAILNPGPRAFEGANPHQEGEDGDDDEAETNPILERLALAAHAGRGVNVQGVCPVETSSDSDEDDSDVNGDAADDDTPDGDAADDAGSHLHVLLGPDCTVTRVTVIGGGLNGIELPEGDGTEGGDTEGDDTEGDGSEGDDTEGDGSEGDGSEGDDPEGDDPESDDSSLDGDPGSSRGNGRGRGNRS